MAGGTSSTELIIDLGLSSLKLRHRARGLELPIRRGPGGKLRPDCRDEVCKSIRQFIEDGRSPRLGRAFTPGRAVRSRRGRRAVCGIPSRGVSLRSLELPAASRDETERLLRFQIEREFPLPLDELAYGYRSSAELNGATPPARPAGDGATQRVLVAALRRDALEEYASMFAECGLNVSFALGSLAALQVCSLGAGHASILDIGRTHSELVDVVDGRPRNVRCLSWGGETVTAAIAKSLGVHPDRAEELKLDPAASAPAGTPPGSAWGSLDGTRHARAVDAAVEDLVGQLQEGWKAAPPGNGSGVPSELVLVGGGSRLPRLPDLIERGLDGSVRCRRVEATPGAAVSAVTEGLERQGRTPNRSAVLRFDATRTSSEKKGGEARRPVVAGWLLAVIVLALASFGLRFAPPLLEEGDLDARIAQRQTQLAAQPAVDLELNFLKMVESNQTPYLEVLAAVAGSAPPGCFISDLSMNRRGDASLRGRIGNAAQLEELRKKLSLSGWFARVVVQERTPQEKHMDFHLLAEFRAETTAGPPVSTPAGEPGPSSPDASKPPAGSDPAAGPPSPAASTGEPAPAATGSGPLTTSEGEAPQDEGSDGKADGKADGETDGKTDGKTTTDSAPKKTPPLEVETTSTDTTTGKIGESSKTTPDETNATPPTSPQ